MHFILTVMGNQKRIRIRMKLSIYISIIILISFYSCKTQYDKSNLYITDELKIEQLTENTFVHTSYLNTKSFGKVPCNGMIVIYNKEAIIYDTPVDNPASLLLINWIKSELKCKIKAVVVTHFHIDCLGGLEEFHNNGIPSFATNLTIELAKTKNKIIPEIGFDKYFEHEIGNKKVISDFLGEGHTKDNIIGYFPSEKILFGGCLIKGMNAGKGNLSDANPNDWSNTVRKVKSKYPEAKVIIPGHGKAGGIELLDYTIEKFKINERP